jgi:predicted nucleic acid-binding protein
MKTFALDTNILSYIIKNDRSIMVKLQKEIDNGKGYVVPPVAYYKI